MARNAHFLEINEVTFWVNDKKNQISAHTRCAVEVAAVGREQGSGPQHGGVQAASLSDAVLRTDIAEK